jgi:hypothetical protein
MRDRIGIDEFEKKVQAIVAVQVVKKVQRVANWQSLPSTKRFREAAKKLREAPVLQYDPNELKRLQKQWKRGDRFAPFFALSHCIARKITPPFWALDAAMIFGLECRIKEQREKYKSRRYQQRQQDSSLHSMVVDWRRWNKLEHAKNPTIKKLTWEKTCEQVAEIFPGKLTAGQVWNAYIRVRRLEKAGKVVE